MGKHRREREARQQQIADEELVKIINRIFGAYDPALGKTYLEHYRQNATMRLLFQAAEQAARKLQEKEKPK